MKKIIIIKFISISTLVLLSGCETGYSLVKKADYVKFPSPPNEGLNRCKNLRLLPDDSRMRDLVDTVSSNYVSYNACSQKNDDWIKWYKSQEEEFNAQKYYK